MFTLLELGLSSKCIKNKYSLGSRDGYSLLPYAEDMSRWSGLGWSQSLDLVEVHIFVSFFGNCSTGKKAVPRDRENHWRWLTDTQDEREWQGLALAITSAFTIAIDMLPWKIITAFETQIWFLKNYDHPTSGILPWRRTCKNSGWTTELLNVCGAEIGSSGKFLRAVLWFRV